ncbi:hypothetical protein [Rhizobium sp. BK176]|uniref:hypothetical protein n=1 Tax=Rhizobium sp. BK176 TaxID=2587071 RepID=UPI0021676B8B|nr:hypothetical protein [Rhizobium sp. BK176]MCS4089250.1 hypothetical protein [Rhizobium sp. BK176]
MNPTHLAKLLNLTEKAMFALIELRPFPASLSSEDDAGRALRLAIVEHRDAEHAVFEIEHAFERLIEETKAQLVAYRAETEEFARANHLEVVKHVHLTIDDLFLRDEVSAAEARRAVVQVLSKVDSAVAKKITDGIRLWVTNARLRGENLDPWKNFITELLEVGTFNVHRDQVDRLAQVVLLIASSNR